jgi:hypothetical protein
MLNLFQHFTSKRKKSSHSDFKPFFINEFLSRPEHYWIKNNSLAQKHFSHLWERLPQTLLEFILEDHVSFMLSQDYRKHTYQQVAHTVVIFPQFQKWLGEEASFVQAYLAHEMAFVIYDLESPQKDHLLAEVEADKFVCDLGLADELEQLLLKMDESPEKRLRLTYLTLNHFGIC